MTKTLSEVEVSDVLAREFGANATYVEQIYERYLHDPAGVDPDWREYFEELVGTAEPSAIAPAAEASRPAAAASAPPTPSAPPASAPIPADRLPIRGPALKIVENMEASLGVPTATSIREIPIKVLDENRRLGDDLRRHLGGCEVGMCEVHPQREAALRRQRVGER